jgi:nicotinate-nucleotide pyrophosphorylase (carboxylating)
MRPYAPGQKAEAIPDALRRHARLLVRAALAEDIGPGDITTEAVVPRLAMGRALIIAKEPLVVAGLFVAEEAFRVLDRGAAFRPRFRDGDAVKRGAVIAEVSGRLRALLSAERVALNFLQRLSGIATLASMFVKEAAGTGAFILDTRKTTPCLRTLEKYSVGAGGGVNHRRGLYDAVLIKDNHIKAAGGVAEAIGLVRKARGNGVVIEAEAATVREAKEAADAGADVIMLDNMDIVRIGKALKAIGGRALVEASGGVTLSNVGAIARTGVDFVSVGALTHSARSMDISMEVSGAWKKKGRP